MKKLAKKTKKKLEVVIIVIISLFSILLWNTFLIYPIKFAVIIFHEISHGIAALITGGSINEIAINSNLSGICSTSGGYAPFVAFAGYLGSLVFGALLFSSAYERKLSLKTNIAIAVVLIIFALGYQSETLSIIFSLILASIIIVSPIYFPSKVHSYLMKCIGFISCLYVIIDIKEDLITLTYRPSDAQILADLSGIPAIIWGFVWLAISITVVYFLIKFSYKKGMTK